MQKTPSPIDIPEDFTHGIVKRDHPRDKSKARYRMLLDLGTTEPGDPGPRNSARLRREAEALAKGSENLWNLRAAAILRKAADMVEKWQHDRRI